MFRPSVLLGLAVALAACSAKPVAVAVETPPPPPPQPVAATMPAGGVPGMTIPARLPDGGWPTPGRDVTADAATWRLRAALNVAALACRGPGQEGIVTAYNTLLTSRRVALAAAQSRYAAEWRAGGADWQDRYDDAMTRVYNFYSQSFARPGFCAAAETVFAELATVPDAELPAVAPRELAELDRPFADFFTAYDAWRTGRQTVIAVAATGAEFAGPPASPPQAEIAEKPVLTVDRALFQLP